MKNIILGLTSILLIFCSCTNMEKGEVNGQAEGVISLKSPGGEMIAPSIEALKKDFSVFANTIKTENSEITAINYLNVKQGYAAIVTYKTKNGKHLQFAVTNSPLVYAENRLKIIERHFDHNVTFFMCENENFHLYAELEDDGICSFSCHDSTGNSEAEDGILIMNK